MKLKTLRNNHTSSLPLPQAYALVPLNSQLSSSQLFFRRSGEAHSASRRGEMPARFGEMDARSMRDPTEMHPRWKRDGSEIWRDAGLYKYSQISRNLSKLQEPCISGGFRRSATSLGLVNGAH